MEDSISGFVNSKSYHYKASRLNYWAYRGETGYDVLHEAIAEAIHNGVTINKGIESVRADRRKDQTALYKRQSENGEDHDRYELFGDDNRYNRGRINANFNYDACNFFDGLNVELEFRGYPKGKHATNGGEVSFLAPKNSTTKAACYFVDFCIPDFGVVVEYNEHEHYYSKERVWYDFQRVIDIESITNIPIIRVRQGSEDVHKIANEVVRMIKLSALKSSTHPMEAA